MGFVSLAVSLALAFGPRVGSLRYYTAEVGFPSTCPRALALTDTELWVGLGATGTPEGLSRITRTSLEAGGPLVVERVSGVTSAVHALLSDGRDALVAADDGLRRWVAGGDGAGFVSLLNDVVVAALARAPDGAIWAVVGQDKGGPEEFTAVPLSALETRRGRPSCRRFVKLVAHAADRATLVCEGAILELGQKAGFAVELTGTPLWREPGKGEGRTPAVWITAATTTADGTIYLLSQRGGLVRYRGEAIEKVLDDGRESRLTERARGGLAMPNMDFMDIVAAANSGGDGVYIADVRGMVYHWENRADGVMMQVWPLVPTFGLQRDPMGERTRLVTATAEGVYFEIGGADGDAFVHVDRHGRATLWSLRRPGTTFSNPGLLNVLPDGERGLWVSTNDGLWRFRR